MEHETGLTMSIVSLGNVYSPQAIELILPIQQLEFNVPVSLKDQPDLQDIDRFYRQSGGGFWGAFIGEDLVGTIGLISIGNNKGVIRKMFVRKDYRGHQWGIAQRLLEILIDYCHSGGIEDIYLGTIDRMKAAHRFYERNGFIPILKADLPAAFPLMKVDNLFYHLHSGATNEQQ